MNDFMLKNIRLQDAVFAVRQKINHQVTIPCSLQRCKETGRLKAFQLQWHEGDPEKPHIYWDSDVAKVLEGMAAALMIQPDPSMEKELNELVDLVISAQQPDGYLNTYFTQVEPDKRWTNLAYHHELYCAGHLIEAAIAHYHATGKRNFLNAMCRYADYICNVFGRGEGQKRGYPGHEEIELALVKLYRTTGEKRYLELARYFVTERGSRPNYYIEQEGLSESALIHIQAHKPLLEQSEADGHAVRAMYLFAGVTDVAAETRNSELLHVAEQIFRNVTECRMYVTGGVGSKHRGESFSRDFDLPNDTAYTESCAAIGLALFAKRLLDSTCRIEYAEVLERVLYNNGLSGVSLAGDTFFYCNPLEISAATFDPIKPVRQKWFKTSCCPTNYCRFLPRLGLFCVDAAPDRLRIDIPAAMSISLPEYEVEVTGKYPYDGAVAIRIKRGGEFSLSLRIPAWCRKYKLFLNGQAAGEAVNGYWTRKRFWQNGDEITIALDMPAEIIHVNPRVPADIGRGAIQRGPLVYCLESVDNPGILLHSVRIPARTKFRLDFAEGLPENTIALHFSGEAAKPSDGKLYRVEAPEYFPVHLCAIPYALWQNRGPADMQIFLGIQ